MVLRMKPNDLFRLRGARGVAIDVVAGRVWITEAGRAQDSFVDAGSSYRVAGDGLVLVGAEPAGEARIAVRASSAGTGARAPRAG